MLTAVLLSRWMGMRAIPAVICMVVSVTGAAMMIGIPDHLVNARFTGEHIVPRLQLDLCEVSPALTHDRRLLLGFLVPRWTGLYFFQLPFFQTADNTPTRCS